MKKMTLRALALLLAVTVIAGAAIGCRSEPESAFPPPEYVFLPEIIPFPPLPEGMSSSGSVTIIGDTAYFSAWGQGSEDSYFHSDALFSMNIDGTNLRELPNYDRPLPPEEAEGGSVGIRFLHGDNSGNLWVVESGNYFWFELPDDFTDDPDEPWRIWEFQRDLDESHNVIRKLDSDGSELLSVDIGFIADESQWGFWVSAFAVDEDGNLYVASGDRLDVLSPEGQLLFTLDGFVDSLISLPDGTVASMGWTQDAGRAMTEIDVGTEDWGDAIEVPVNAHTAFPGNDEFLFVFNDQTALFGFDAELDEPVQILSWIDSDVSIDGLGNITFLDDGRLFVTTENWGADGSGTELVFLTRMRYEDLPERTLLTLATFGLNWVVRSAIIDFNRTSTTHRIQVIDYSRYNTFDDWTVGMTRLTTEMIAGRVPDIIDVSRLPYEQYMARGLLMDLYSFIDEDPELSRSDLMENVLSVIEIDGELPFVFSGFGIHTVTGSPAVVGATPGWTVEEFITTLDANPQADMPMGNWLTRESFLHMSVMLGMHNFVDWGSGTVNFDGGDFAALLEIANRFPPEPDRDDEATVREWTEDDWVDPVELIATGRQIMERSWLWDFHSLQRTISLFGGDIVFKGFPTENRNGHTLFTETSLAITTSSVDPDGAWSFVRTVLTEDFQREMWGFPTSRILFEERQEEAMTPPDEDEGIMWGWGWGEMTPIEPLTQEQVDQVFALIDSVTGTEGRNEDLMRMVTEVAEDFFNGLITAQDAARFLQDRAAIYVSEIS